jgi:hypothetical protein
MASALGTPVSAIARPVAEDEDTVRDVIHAFNEEGWPRRTLTWAGGRPRLISDHDIAFIARDGQYPTRRGGCPVHALAPAQTRRPSRPRPSPANPGRAGTKVLEVVRAREAVSLWTLPED